MRLIRPIAGAVLAGAAIIGGIAVAPLVASAATGDSAEVLGIPADVAAELGLTEAAAPELYAIYEQYPGGAVITVHADGSLTAEPTEPNIADYLFKAGS